MDTSLTVTGYGCPTQIEGTTATGESVYFRYRWGQASLQIDGQTVWTACYGHAQSGVMESATALRLVTALLEARAAHQAALQELPVGPVPPLDTEAEAMWSRLYASPPPSP